MTKLNANGDYNVTLTATGDFTFSCTATDALDNEVTEDVTTTVLSGTYYECACYYKVYEIMLNDSLEAEAVTNHY